MVHQSIKDPVLLLWLEGATFHWVISGYKFNIMNTCHVLAASDIEDVSINITNKLHDKRSTKKLQNIFQKAKHSWNC